MRGRAPRATVVGCACAVALLAGACGSAPPASVSPSGLVLSAAAVERLPPGSPQRALIAWWRAVQTGDRRGSAALLPGGDPKLAARLVATGAVVRSLRPAIVEVDLRGPSAVVYTEILARRPIGTRRFVPTTSIPQAFALDRIGGRWRLRDYYGLFRLVLGDLARSPSG